MKKVLPTITENQSFVKVFLDFIARDIKKNPSNIEPLTEAIYHRVSVLTEGMDDDLGEELPEDFIFV